jgi:hypothetical protein
MTLLLDTGPLGVAIDRSDKHHARCAALLESPKAAFLTWACWSAFQTHWISPPAKYD